MANEDSINFLRLLSDESTASTFSEDSEVYQTQILELLPSLQAIRPEHNRQGYTDTEPDPVTLSYGSTLRIKPSTQPLRNRPMCLQAKRDVQNRREMQKVRIGFWESWRQSQNINRKRSWDQMKAALRWLMPWQRTLHTIEGRFGVGVMAYFGFLRYLVYLNLLLCALVGGFILAPTSVYGRDINSELFKFVNDSVLDFFLGTGYLDRSPVFYGFYAPRSHMQPCLNTPLLYLIGVLSIFFISLIMVVRRTVLGYKHTWILGKRYNTFISYKIFCGWDHTIQDPAAAALKHGFVRNDLKLFLDEQAFSLREAQRTLGQWVRLYLLRFILNLFVISLLGGAFYLIYKATETSQLTPIEPGHYSLVSLIRQYLPPIVITMVNMFLPHVFRKISAFEDNSFTTQVNATLVRSIFLKLASLGMYLFFLFKTNNERSHNECWENQYGREMYKLCIFNFLAIFVSAFFINYPRKVVQEKFPTSLLARLSGKQQFLIPLNVLDLVYAQTVSWVGVYYCPLLPVIGAVTLTATFYIKKFTLLRCCVAEQRMFRASSSSVLFHFMSLIGLVMAGVTLAYTFLRLSPSSSCGPFQCVINVTEVCVESLPSPVPTILNNLSSAVFAFPLLMSQIVILTFYLSRSRANKKTIERLKHMLVMTSSDKHFLVKQQATILRCRKKHAGSAQLDKSRTSPIPSQDDSEGI